MVDAIPFQAGDDNIESHGNFLHPLKDAILKITLQYKVDDPRRFWQAFGKSNFLSVMSRQRMKRLVRSASAVVAAAIRHSLLLITCSVLAFVGAFGAPQGGDAMKAADQHPARVAFLRFLFDAAVWVLSLPCSALGVSLTLFSAAWIFTSLAWGLLALVVLRRIFRSRTEVV